jgi:hypothetical protein
MCPRFIFIVEMALVAAQQEPKGYQGTQDLQYDTALATPPGVTHTRHLPPFDSIRLAQLKLRRRNARIWPFSTYLAVH